MREEDEKYIERKIRDIEGYIAVAVGASSMISALEGRTTDGVIMARDNMTKRVVKTVRQIIKRIA